MTVLTADQTLHRWLEDGTTVPGVQLAGSELEQTTSVIYNVTLASADTEYSQALPASCRAFQFQCRTSYAVRYAFETGRVATPTAPYFTLGSGLAYYKENLNLSSATLYLASPQAGVVVELECWT